MPNFFSMTNQKLYEAFHGPKTIDTEFNMKVEEVKQADRNVYHLQQLFNRVPHFFHGIKDYYYTLVSIIDSSYAKNSSHYPYINEISLIYKELHRLYEVYMTNVNSFSQQTGDWLRMLDDVKHDIKERERLRQIHDHYDDKIEDLVRRRNRHLEKNQIESASFIEAFERNNLKYKVAAENYLNQSTLAYQKMCDFLDYRTRLLNPTLENIIQEEVVFFSNANGLILRLQDLANKLRSLDSSQRGINNIGEYDPSKYIRGRHMLENYATNITNTSNFISPTIQEHTESNILRDNMIVAQNIQKGSSMQNIPQSDPSLFTNLDTNVQQEVINVPTTNPEVTGVYKENETIPTDIKLNQQIEREKEIQFENISSKDLSPKKEEMMATTKSFKEGNFYNYQEGGDHVFTGYTPESFQIEEEDRILSEEEMSERALRNLNIKAEDIIVKELHPNSETTKVSINLENLKDPKSQSTL